VDWYLDGRDATTISQLRHEIADYLRRHAEPGADLAGAELAVSELLTNVGRHAPGPAWVHVDAAEAAVAQVGADVGGRMEGEYRRARDVAGQLSVEQIADLYVRLKAAIDGDFYVVEATPERIVLGNRRCPFGEVVKRAPGLCRMTSSVFGGIASRNTGGASVVLEERIAVGDPECRVVVWLTGARRGEWTGAHEYGAA
jgi:hypothetical protein